MLFLLQLILNTLVFLILFNLNWVIEKSKNPRQVEAPAFKSLVIPIILGVFLTLLDALRIQFLVQLVVLAAMAAGLYWVFSIFSRR